MVKIWGDVPLRLLPSESVDPLFNVERTDQLAVLDACFKDFDFAIDNLLDNYRAGYGRANALIANAVAAKASLIKAARTHAAEDYQAAADYAYEVIKTGKYDLYPDYGDNFVISKEHGIESILSINYGINDTWKSQFNVSLLPSEIRKNSPGGSEGPDNANSWIAPTKDLYMSFAEGDLRRDITIMKDFTYSDGSVYVFEGNAKYPYYYTKYWDRTAEPDGKNSDQNYPYMRYSEVLLIYAEALNEVHQGPTTEAYRAINKVRDRAFKDNGSGAHDLKNLDYAGFRKAILDERRWELALEGSRWFDLVRLSTDFAQTVKRVKPNAYPEEKHKLFPIPQYERLLNGKITQNDGYLPLDSDLNETTDNYPTIRIYGMLSSGPDSTGRAGQHRPAGTRYRFECVERSVRCGKYQRRQNHVRRQRRMGLQRLCSRMGRNGHAVGPIGMGQRGFDRPSGALRPCFASGTHRRRDTSFQRRHRSKRNRDSQRRKCPERDFCTQNSKMAPVRSNRRKR